MARVGQADQSAYQTVLTAATSAFGRWRVILPPEGGLFVRAVAEELRCQREDPGTLIVLEVGKIRAEGIGEIQ